MERMIRGAPRRWLVSIFVMATTAFLILLGVLILSRLTSRLVSRSFARPGALDYS